MYKIVTFFCCVIITISTSAQTVPTYQFSDFELEDYDMPKQFTRVSLNGILNSPAEGSNITWDFTSYQANNPQIIQLYKVRDSLFPGSNILQTDNEDYIKGTFIPYDLYTRFDNTGNAIAGRHYFHLGMDLAFISGTPGDSLVIPDQAVEYMPSWYSLQFPQTYPAQFTSSTKYELLGEITFSLAGYDHIPFTKQTIEIRNETIDGWGQAIIPLPTGGSATVPCILQKSSMYAVDSFFVNGQPAPSQLLAAFGMYQGEITTNSASYLYQQGEYMPLITHVHSDDDFGPVSAIYMTYDELGYASVVENDIDNLIQIFPNPSNGNNIFIKTENDIEQLQIIDIAGKIVYSLKSIGNKKEMSIPENITNGIYFLQIINTEQTISKKFLLQR